jgi:co-chaperonin GroES (HSP10)
MTIKVTGCRLLVKPFKITEQHKDYARAAAANIIIPEFSERKEQINVDKGTVLQVGPTCHEDYVGDVKVGDVIGYAKFGGKFIADPKDDEMYLVINDEDIICVFKED